MKRSLAFSAVVACAAAICRPGAAQSAGDAAAAPSASAASEEAPPSAVDRCVADHERAATLRAAKRWAEAREVMTQCTSEACPLAIRADCSTWLDELVKLVPSLLVIVERDDATTPPRLEIDGRIVDLSDPPTPIELMPGKHRVQVTIAGYPPVEREIVLAEGEKNQVLRVRFARPQPKASPPAPPAHHWSRPIPVSTYVFAGAAVAAFATSGSLLASALVSRSDARASCAPECPSDQVRSIRLRLVLSDVAGGAGLFLSGLVAYTFIHRPSVELVGWRATPTLSVGRTSSQILLTGAFW